MFAKHAEELLIYRLAFKLATDIANLVKPIPHNWNIEEVGQVLSSSSSVPSNITEGFAQRFYPKKFLYFLNIALGSSDESQGHLRKLCNDGYINAEIADDLIKRYKDLSIRILNFINCIKKKHNIRL